jgi:hypothetical protein
LNILALRQWFAMMLAQQILFLLDLLRQGGMIGVHI